MSRGRDLRESLEEGRGAEEGRRTEERRSAAEGMGRGTWALKGHRRPSPPGRRGLPNPYERRQQRQFTNPFHLRRRLQEAEEREEAARKAKDKSRERLEQVEKEQRIKEDVLDAVARVVRQGAVWESGDADDRARAQALHNHLLASDLVLNNPPLPTHDAKAGSRVQSHAAKAWTIALPGGGTPVVVYGLWRCHNRLSVEDTTGVAKCLAAALDAASEAGVGEEIFVSIEEELASREVLPPEERPSTSHS